jgi:E3 ubiquitin-protein ligase HECTD1
VATLTAIVAKIESACQKQAVCPPLASGCEGSDWRTLLAEALDELTVLLEDETKVSAFELHSSGLIQSLLKLFSTSASEERRSAKRLQRQRLRVFLSSFADRKSTADPDLVVSPSCELVRKLVAVLETIEKLPLYLYDPSASGYGLQILTRRLRFRLERVPGEDNLIDRSGCSLKMEPLASVGQLQRFLLKMVAKQWFDYDRATFSFIKQVSYSLHSILAFSVLFFMRIIVPSGGRRKAPALLLRSRLRRERPHVLDRNERALLERVGEPGPTRTGGGDVIGGPQSAVRTPGGHSESRRVRAQLPHQRRPPRVVRHRPGRVVHPHRVHAQARQRIRKVRSQNLAAGGKVAFVDVPSDNDLLTLPLASQVSKDGVSWTTICDHVDDCSLNEPGSTATWRISLPASEDEEPLGWRHVRIMQNGKNASAQTHYLSLSGLELYGSVNGVCEELGK